MCKHGDFGKNDMPVRVKLQYEEFMKMEPGATDPKELDVDPESLLQLKGYIHTD